MATPLVAELSELNVRFAPVTLAGEQRIPVLDGLTSVVPGGGLQRGTFLSVHSSLGCGVGATTLAFALAAGAAAAGSWVAVVGVGDLGLGAMADVGLPLDRVVLIDQPAPRQWATVVAALFDAFELIVVAPDRQASATDSRRLQARARERGSVVLQLSAEWPAVIDGVRKTAGRVPGARPSLDREHSRDADVSFGITGLRWAGLGQGNGILRSRQVEVEVSGRRLGPATTHRLWLPNDDGAILPVSTESAAVDSDGGVMVLGTDAVPSTLAPVVPIRAVGA